MKQKEAKITLRQFLYIAPDVIHPEICRIFFEEEHPNYRKNISQLKVNGNEYFGKIEILKPYYDYEVTGFNQDYYNGELDEQQLYLKK